jgi:biotin carboxylase
MSRILVLCPSHRDHRELPRLTDGAHHLYFHDYASIALEQMVSAVQAPADVGDPEAEIEAIVAKYRGQVDAVLSTDDYPGSTLASIVAARMGLPGTAPRNNLLCQHKLHSRIAQKIAVPEAVPEFTMLHAGGPQPRYPCFVKPVKSFFSIGACRVDNAGQLERARASATLPDSFFAPFRTLYEHHVGEPFGDGSVLAEGLLEGLQFTVEGFAFAGEVEVIAIVDSVMFPGTVSFRRFDYPSRLPDSVQARAARLAARVMRAIGFSHGQFNIELMYDAARDTLSIIEINPRMASQFADMYEKVDGWSSYEGLVDLALGRRPRPLRRAGRHGVAVSHVLRRFDDAFVEAVADAREIREIERRHPDVRVEILCTPGMRLSQEMQDGASYRYGIVNVGARDWNHVDEVIADCVSRLGFRLADVDDQACRSRSAFVTTDTELKLIATAAIMGESSRPVSG